MTQTNIYGDEAYAEIQDVVLLVGAGKVYLTTIVRAIKKISHVYLQLFVMRITRIYTTQMRLDTTQMRIYTTQMRN